MKYLIMCVSVLLLSSCAYNAKYFNALSSGSTGCPAEQVQTSNYKDQGGVVTWVAQCNGSTYYCSGPYHHAGEIESVTCKPAQTQ